VADYLEGLPRLRSIMQRNATQEEFSSGEILRVTGIFTGIFSVVMTLLSLFALPAACAALASVLITFSGIFLVGGVVMWAIGWLKDRRLKD
jgi:hypothetical protein